VPNATVRECKINPELGLLCISCPCSSSTAAIAAAAHASPLYETSVNHMFLSDAGAAWGVPQSDKPRRIFRHLRKVCYVYFMKN
jgi:hypothetical protein